MEFQNWNSSEEFVMGSIDLLGKIMKFLGPKSLARCGLVSKAWREASARETSLRQEHLVGISPEHNRLWLLNLTTLKRHEVLVPFTVISLVTSCQGVVLMHVETGKGQKRLMIGYPLKNEWALLAPHSVLDEGMVHAGLAYKGNKLVLIGWMPGGANWFHLYSFEAHKWDCFGGIGINVCSNFLWKDDTFYCCNNTRHGVKLIKLLHNRTWSDASDYWFSMGYDSKLHVSISHDNSVLVDFWEWLFQGGTTYKSYEFKNGKLKNGNRFPLSIFSSLLKSGFDFGGNGHFYFWKDRQGHLLVYSLLDKESYMWWGGAQYGWFVNI